MKSLTALGLKLTTDAVVLGSAVLQWPLALKYGLNGWCKLVIIILEFHTKY